MDSNAAGGIGGIKFWTLPCRGDRFSLLYILNNYTIEVF